MPHGRPFIWKVVDHDSDPNSASWVLWHRRALMIFLYSMIQMLYSIDSYGFQDTTTLKRIYLINNVVFVGNFCLIGRVCDICPSEMCLIAR